MSGYIALNAISFSVCRPHKALNVDTLHISCKQEKGQAVTRGKIQGLRGSAATLLIMVRTHVLKVSREGQGGLRGWPMLGRLQNTKCTLDVNNLTQGGIHKQILPPPVTDEVLGSSLIQGVPWEPYYCRSGKGRGLLMEQ